MDQVKFVEYGLQKIWIGMVCFNKNIRELSSLTSLALGRNCFKFHKFYILQYFAPYETPVRIGQSTSISKRYWDSQVSRHQCTMDKHLNDLGLTYAHQL